MSNDTLWTAEFLDITEQISGSVGGWDTRDYFWFSLPYSGTITIGLTGLFDDIDLNLLDAEGYELDSSNASGLQSENIIYTVEAGSIYYINVEPFRDASSSYLLSVNLLETFITDSLIGSDVSDFRSSAPFVSLSPFGGKVLDGSVGFGSDTGDFYKIVSPGTGTASITLSGLDDDIDLELLSQFGAILDVSSANGSAHETVTVPVTAGETYYIHVDPFGTSASEYTLSIDFPVGGISVSEAMSVARLYQAGLGRQPDTGGLNYWIDAYEAGMSKFEIADSFMESREFVTVFGDDLYMSDEDFVDLLYINVLGRFGEETGVEYWTDALGNGVSRPDLLTVFADSEENIAGTQYLQNMTEYDGYWYY